MYAVRALWACFTLLLVGTAHGATVEYTASGSGGTVTNGTAIYGMQYTATADKTLSEVEFYISPSAGSTTCSTIHTYVMEQESGSFAWNIIASTTASASAGAGWKSSGELKADIVSGNKYRIILGIPCNNMTLSYNGGMASAAGGMTPTNYLYNGAYSTFGTVPTPSTFTSNSFRQRLTLGVAGKYTYQGTASSPSSFGYGGRMLGNEFTAVDDSIIDTVEWYLRLGSSCKTYDTYIHEQESGTTTWVKKAQSSVTGTGTATQWYSSGNLGVVVKSGNKYRVSIGIACSSINVNYRSGGSGTVGPFKYERYIFDTSGYTTFGIFPSSVTSLTGYTWEQRINFGASACTPKTWYLDDDSDGYGGSTTVSACTAPSGYIATAGDCDDGDNTIYPGATEVVGDAKDQDCDGTEVCYLDADNDSYRTTTTVASTDTDCSDSREALASEPANDCNDSNATINPGATEGVGDSVDQNCDGREVCFTDADNDSYRTSSTVASADTDCLDSGEGAASDPSGDCNDSSASINPGATEGVGDGVDQDCDGGETCYADADGDSYRTTTTISSSDTDCSDAGEALASVTAGDCDDTDNSIYPGASETIADGIDSDCDGGEVCYEDADGDGYVIGGGSTTTEYQGSGTAGSGPYNSFSWGNTYTANSSGKLTDVEFYYKGATGCNVIDIYIFEQVSGSTAWSLKDSVANKNIGWTAGWHSAGGVDVTITSGNKYRVVSSYTCTGTARMTLFYNSNLAGTVGDFTQTHYVFKSGYTGSVPTGFNESAAYTMRQKLTMRAVSPTVTSADADCSDSGEALSTAPTGDCDDSDNTINPGASETVADGIDQDCDGSETCYVDGDDDSYRTTTTVVSADTDCSDSGEALASDASGDCDDADATINPGATETVADGVDQDCDGGEVCYADGDNDAYRTSSTVTSSDADCSDSGEALDSVPAGDCDDTDSSINPGATESVADGVDQDCDGSETCYVDGDGDGYRTSATITSSDADCSDSGEALASDPSGDCDDASASINPGATEGVGDGVDQDCDGGEVCYADGDNDAYRTSSTVASSDADCADSGEALASVTSGDCDDTDAAVNPGATEGIGDGLDQNCDGAEVCYVDADDDGYRLTTTVASSDTDCADSGEALDSDPTGDCDDTDKDTNPGATEVTADGKDQDCDGGEICYADGDNDTYRTSSTVTSSDADCSDSGEALATATSGDCDDTDSSIYPGATETVADGIDQDCDGGETCYEDLDDDGYRTSITATSSDSDCADSGEALETDPSGDCNDFDKDTNPGATEVAYDGVDQDCSGADLCDVDEDGYDANVGSCVGPDCDDDDADRNPMAAEIWYDGVDQDCDGWSDYDQDGDGFDSDDYEGDDCDDQDEEVNPDAEEIWYDGIDQDCDEWSDYDQDGDGYDSEDYGGDDCDDEADDVYPGAEELEDGIDNDCDGVDEAADTDGDGITDEDEQDLGTDPESGDSDGDGLGDAEELDEDGSAPDSDGDGTPDVLDDDDDGDGILTIDELADDGSIVDTDEDGTPDYLDTDSDDDGFGDAVEGNVDTDGDGTADFQDSDSDNDTVPDADEFDGDTDEDGTPDRLDDDDDGDGYSTETENGWSSTDIDEDGTPNYIDTDADGDGTPDADEGEGDVDCDNIENVQDSNDLDGVCDDGDDGCGCTAAPAPSMLAMWMGLFGLLITVRRRRA